MSDYHPRPPGVNATELQARPVAATAPTDGQVLTWDHATQTWRPEAGGGGSSPTLEVIIEGPSELPVVYFTGVPLAGPLEVGDVTYPVKTGWDFNSLASYAMPGVTAMTFPTLEVVTTNINVQVQSDLVEFNFPALVKIFGSLAVTGPSLTTGLFPALLEAGSDISVDQYISNLDLSALRKVGGAVYVSNTNLVALDLSSLEEASSGIYIWEDSGQNLLLESVDLSGLKRTSGAAYGAPLWVTYNPVLSEITLTSAFVSVQDESNLNFTNNALTQSCVDNLLVRFAAATGDNCTLYLWGGTNATPSATGIAAMVTLLGRGWNVTVNGLPDYTLDSSAEVSVVDTGVIYGNVAITNNADLTDISFPDLLVVTGNVSSDTPNSALTTLDLSAATVMGFVHIGNNTALTEATFASLKGTAYALFYNCALTQASVDAIIAAAVAGGATYGGLDLSGGTNAIPSATGIAGLQTLMARGWEFNTNIPAYELTGSEETSVTDTGTVYQTVSVHDNASLTSLAMDVEAVMGSLIVAELYGSNPLLETIDLSHLKSVGNIAIYGSVLSSVTLGALTDLTGTVHHIYSDIMSEAVVDAVMVELAALYTAKGYTGHSLFIGSLLQPFSSTSLAAKATIEALGNTVTDYYYD